MILSLLGFILTVNHYRPLGVRGWLRLVIVALPGLFYYLLFILRGFTKTKTRIRIHKVFILKYLKTGKKTYHYNFSSHILSNLISSLQVNLMSIAYFPPPNNKTQINMLNKLVIPRKKHISIIYGVN